MQRSCWRSWPCSAPLLLGLRVGNTIATIVDVPAAQTVEVVGAALTAAVT